MRQHRLFAALAYLCSLYPNRVTAIQLEDGGEKKFNFQLDGSCNWQYIDLTNII